LTTVPRDLDALLTALRAYLPYGHTITGIRQMTYGLSNGTYALEGAGKILRMPPEEEGLLPPYDMARQHEIYRRVGSTPGAPPVPPMLELCEDESIAGVPFYVMERLEGESFDRHNLPAWLTTDPVACGELCRTWVEAMASVHRMPVDTLDGPVRTSESEAAQWLTVARDLDAPAPILDVFERFLDEPPPDSGLPTPVHGDPNITNLLWDRTRLVALLDWELSGIGEPFADIAFMLAFFRDEGEPASWGFEAEGWWTKPQVVRHWEAVTGRTVQKWRHHELLAMARLATILAIGDRLVVAGRKSDPRVGEFTSKLPRYVERIERRLLRMDVDD
jgi:aminoglycoside phosphotransferase (APT) family kinase protein